MKISKPTNHKWLILRGGGKLPNANCEHQTTKLYHQSGSEWLRTVNFSQFTTFPIFSHRSGSEWLQAANFTQFTTFPIFSHWSGSEWFGTAKFAWFATFPINDQMQIVNTKLPNENIQTYQSQMIDSRGGGGVNYQMQIVIKLPNGTTKVAQNDSEQPILPNSQLFQSFSTKVALKMTLNSQFCPIHNFSNLFPLKWLRMTQNSQFHPIHNFANLSLPEWLRMTQNGQFCLIHNFSNLFPLKWLSMTQSSQLHLICNFSNLFPLKWLRMIWNGQICLICNFSNLFPLKWLRMT